MDFIKEYIAFERWLKINHLPPLSQLLWHKLFGLFNMSGWAEWVTVGNADLMAMIQVKREATFIELRDHLIRAGLIAYRKGKKGCPNQYRYISLCTFTSEVETVVQTVVESEVESEVQTVDLYKTKKKTKTKTEKEEETPSDLLAGLDEPLGEKVREWLRYKSERRESYKPTGLRSLIATIQNKRKLYSDQQICELIDCCMSNGWKGIIWDRLGEKPPAMPKSAKQNTSAKIGGHSSLDMDRLHLMLHQEAMGR